MHYLWRFLFLHAVYLLWELDFSQNEQGKYVFQGFFFLYSLIQKDNMVLNLQAVI